MVPIATLGGLLAVAALGLCLAASRARADDTIRRVQEELRKRNLYFGDIDGQHNRGILGAIRRYQERKGFPTTGQPDEITLRSLNISATANPGETTEDPWPETPILKSDQARRPPPLSASVLGEMPPADAGGTGSPIVPTATSSSSGGVNPGPNGGPPVVMERGTPQMAESNSAATPAPAPPAGSENAAAPPTREAVRAFIEGYLRAGATNDTQAELGYYGDVVDYFNKGPAGRDYIARDVRQYYRRWPKRHFEILGPVSVEPGPGAGQSTVRFLLRYIYHGNVHGQERQVEGRTENIFNLAGGPREEDLRIVGMREQRVRP